MTIEGTKLSVSDEDAPETAETTSQSEPSPRVGEGVGVFRGIILMLLSYALFGFLIWLAWHAWRQSRLH